MPNHRHPTGLAMLLVAALALTTGTFANDRTPPPFQDYRAGDIVLQHIESPLCKMIAAVTESPYSHCGLVVYRGTEPYVLEAVGTVSYTPLARWLATGDRGRVTVVRVKDLTPAQIAKAIQAAQAFFGKSYDIQYQPDDRKIYCSELIYKAFRNGCGIEVGAVQRLGDLKWQPHEAAIRQLAGGELPLDRRMVTPVTLVDSPLTTVVYSSFPKPSTTTGETPAQQ